MLHVLRLPAGWEGLGMRDTKSLALSGLLPFAVADLHLQLSVRS